MTITTEDPRDLKALAAVREAGQWAKVRDASGKALAYGVPSATRPGMFHFATATQCTCKDHEHGHHCYHSRAVGLHLALTKSQRQLPPMTDAQARKILGRL